MSLPLIVRHHQQDDSTCCGRACAQMVIGFESARLGVASGTALPGQLAMKTSETGTMADWATEPAELATHIKMGLLTLPGAKTWEVVEFKPSAASTDPKVEVASGLFNVVVQKLNAGFPSVVMIDANDHWETAFNYTVATGHTELHTIDPLPGLVSPPTVPHSDLDACSRSENTVWFFDSISAGAFICDTPIFVGSAIGIVQTDPSDWWSGGPTDPGRGRPPVVDWAILTAWRERFAINEFNVRDPLPPVEKNLPLIALMNFFKRDMWRMIGAMERLPEAASYLDFDWSRVVVRHASFVTDPDRKMAIVAAPPRQGKERSILLSIDQRGAVEAMRLTLSARMVRSLESAGDEPLWIVPKYGRWLPFVKAAQDGPAARFRRLYDGFEIRIAPEAHEKR